MTQVLPTTRPDPRPEVMSLSDHQWCVCDRGVDAGDARRVLGYIEQQELIFDVLALAPALRHCGHFDNWEAALQALLGGPAAGEDPSFEGTIELVSRNVGDTVEYHLVHDFDVVLLHDVSDGPYRSLDDARRAARLLLLVLAGNDD